jgi:Zn-dependent protease with chaperone function
MKVIGNICYNLSDKTANQRSDFDHIDLKKFFDSDGIRANCPEISNAYKYIKIGQNISLTVIGLALLFVIIIIICGKLTKNNRKLLVWIFSPGLYLTAVLCIGVTIANATTLILSIYYIESWFLGIIHFKILLCFVLGAIFGIYTIIASILTALKKPENYVEGENLSEQQYPQIWEFVKSIAGKMNAKVPCNITAGFEPTFYATKISTNIGDKHLKGETLFISLTLARILTISEFTSVIGHELSHFTNNDIKYTTKFYPIYVGAINALEKLSPNHGDSSISFIPLLPAYIMLNFFLSAFTTSERIISRNRELIADSLSAQINGDALSSATALVKIQKHTPLYYKVLDTFWQEIKKTHSFKDKNLSLAFMQETKNILEEDAIKNLEISIMSHSTDTHPTLLQRLSNIGIELDDALDASSKAITGNSAVTLIDNHEALETKLSKVIKNNMLINKLKIAEKYKSEKESENK